jgi:hypothetical protein
MKIKLYFLLLLITLISFIIIPGCGGGSNSVNPTSSITTPTPTGAFGYITINIAWPQRSKDEKKCLLTLKNNNKELTASMPTDTETVVVKIRDFNDKDDPNALLDPNHATRIFYWGPGTENEDVYDILGPLPAIKVIVRAEAYNTSFDEIPTDEIPISVVEQELQIKPGTPEDNTVDLALGDYIIGLTPTAPNAGDTSCDAIINTTLSINYPNSVGIPTPTPLPNSVGNRTIKFEVNEVRYTGTEPNVTVTPTDIIFDLRQLTLDGDGNGSVKVTSKISPVTVSIMASLINLDDETRILSSNTCEININKKPPEYVLSLTANPSNLIIIPNFISNYFDLVTDSIITAKITRVNPYPYSTPIPLEGKQINFSISGDANLSSSVGHVVEQDDGNGICQVKLTSNIENPGPRQIVIKAETIIDSNITALKASLIIPVKDNLIVKENFETYQYNDLLYNIYRYSHTWNFRPYNYPGYDNYIDNIVPNNTSLLSARTYGEPYISASNTSVKGVSFSLIDFSNFPSNIQNVELRFYIRLGNETLTTNKYIPTRYRAHFIFNGYYAMLFRDDNKIVNFNKEEISEYASEQWYDIRMQFISGNPKKIIYCINGEIIETNADPGSATPSMQRFGVLTLGGTVWYDEIKFYNLDGLKNKNNKVYLP